MATGCSPRSLALHTQSFPSSYHRSLNLESWENWHSMAVRPTWWWCHELHDFQEVHWDSDLIKWLLSWSCTVQLDFDRKHRTSSELTYWKEQCLPSFCRPSIDSSPRLSTVESTEFLHTSLLLNQVHIYVLYSSKMGNRRLFLAREHTFAWKSLDLLQLFPSKGHHSWKFVLLNFGRAMCL